MLYAHTVLGSVKLVFPGEDMAVRSRSRVSAVYSKFCTAAKLTVRSPKGYLSNGPSSARSSGATASERLKIRVSSILCGMVQALL